MSKAREEAEKWLAKHDIHYESDQIIENLLTELSQYQKVAAKAAEYIRLSPCGPDITKEQAEAWREYGAAMAEMALAQMNE